MKKKIKIFVVEDDPPLNSLICKFMKVHEFSDVTGFHSVEEMLPNLPKKKEVIIIQDYELPGLNGLDCIKMVKSKQKNVEFIFLSGQNSIQVALEAIKQGAFDYIQKDSFAKENVAIKIKNLLRIKKLEKTRLQIQGLLFFLLGVLIALLTYVLLTGKG